MSTPSVNHTKLIGLPCGTLKETHHEQGKS